ncbi:hypothetical protein Y032_0217g2410 [Ancylostoma ceylanicum]|uniref:Uncharacterized protein n=1 Tax=Ancylostoma ceylanicum TaxID=53326 RepID=A0A016SJ62_9BILA|nr:hypothetical protein Y032_0217g2410 [Ancylostoma ceylanicum]
MNCAQDPQTFSKLFFLRSRLLSELMCEAHQISMVQQADPGFLPHSKSIPKLCQFKLNRRYKSYHPFTSGVSSFTLPTSFTCGDRRRSLRSRRQPAIVAIATIAGELWG